MATTDEAATRLRTLKHIVVVMLENRSFDHMLGYLKLEGMSEVDGLTGEEFNVDRKGRQIRVRAFDAERSDLQRHGEALQKRLDPDHSIAGVKLQLGKGYGTTANGGFVKSFIESRKAADGVGENLWMVPMGYYTSKDLPVYDHLARQYCVCDRWFSSVPGDTWPNRLHAVTGTEGPKVLREAGLGVLNQLGNLPLYDVPAFTRRLKPQQWRWYSHDPGTLRLIDSAYRKPSNPMRDNFAFFDRRKIDWLTETLEAPIVRGGSFLDDAARGTLPRVSWIDPNFVDLSVLETSSNDDHPPSDIRSGQAFVFDVYDALRRSRDWDDTLLIITYDEHGGFFDHVSPPSLPSGISDKYKTYGVRVPAIIVGPRVKRQVLHDPPAADGVQYDHTTLIKTILLAAADDPAAALATMPARVRRAPHVGGLLLDEPRTDVDDPRNARDLMVAWREEARRRRLATAAAPGGEGRSPAPDGAGHPTVLTQFQAEWVQFAAVMNKVGVDV